MVLGAVGLIVSAGFFIAAWYPYRKDDKARKQQRLAADYHSIDAQYRFPTIESLHEIARRNQPREGEPSRAQIDSFITQKRAWEDALDESYNFGKRRYRGVGGNPYLPDPVDPLSFRHSVWRERENQLDARAERKNQQDIQDLERHLSDLAAGWRAAFPGQPFPEEFRY